MAYLTNLLATPLAGEKNIVIKINGRNIYIHWSTPSAVIGFKIRVQTNESTVPLKVHGIPSPFSWSVPLDDPKWRVAYTSKEAVDMTGYENITQLNATFTGANVIDLDETSVSLFNLNEWVDGCDEPDSSLHSTSTSVGDSLGTRATISCNTGFKQMIGYATCPKNGDWEFNSKVVNCEPITCKPFAAVGVEYRPDLVKKLAVHGTKAYYKCKNYDGGELGDGHNYVECNESGDWQGKLEQCDSQTLGFFSKHSYPILGSVVVIFLIIAVGVYLIVRRKNRLADNNATVTMKCADEDYEHTYAYVNVEINQPKRYCLPSLDEYDDCSQQTEKSKRLNTIRDNKNRSYLEVIEQEP